MRNTEIRWPCGVIALIVVIAIFWGLFAALQDKTEYGECVGINSEKKPEFVYTYSTRNIIIGIVAIKSVFIPVYVVLKRAQCPTAKATP